MKNSRFPQPVILVVEDDQLLRLLTADIVEDAGFTALQADNADQALDILAARSDIAMLITDVNMPGSMTGVDLAYLVCGRWPQVKIIVVSSRALGRALPAGCRYISKPYNAEKVIIEMRSMIGA